VLIPASNAVHLMLKPAVVQAVREGRFRLWAVSTVDEALELLTGLPAGTPDAQGPAAQGTVYARIAAGLQRLAQLRKEFGRSSPEAGLAES
jgi:predicted ATP-dependent protease